MKRFVATFEGGSLGKAAETLSISQPGLSKSIHQLEAEFGAKLLDRADHGPDHRRMLANSKIVV